MKRLSEAKIEYWFNNSKHALLIDGARQVGKTYMIRQFIKKTGYPCVEFNFLTQEDNLETLKNASSTKEIIRLFSFLSNEKLVKGKSIIFLDEVQEYPEIITLIKALVDEGSYRYILSGSLLGLTLKSVRSYPVGYIDRFTLYPMTFTEFALANEVRKETLDYLEECFMMKKEVYSNIHNSMMNLFRIYLISGGMPEAVSSFLSNNPMTSIECIQKSIIDSYKIDFTKYEEQTKRLKILEIYNNIPSQLSKQDMRFIFSYLKQGSKFNRYEDSFTWLKDSGTAIPVYVVDHIQSPFIVSRSTNVFKLFYNDVGLFTSTYPLEARQSLLNPDNQLSNGPLYENFVAQELLGQGHSPFFYKSKKIGEVDFIVEMDGKILPLEVKSGKDFKKHKSLNNFLAEKEFKVTEGYVLCNNNVLKEESITYYPIYMTMFLKEKEREDFYIDPVAPF